ncbi:MAG: ferritin-like domain-containing protein [Bacillota bacterium]|jgi:rubrerythrin
MDTDGHICGYPNYTFMNDLVKSLNGEYAAIICYERLAKQAPSAEEKKRILEIRRDEIKHFKGFNNIYLTLTGRKFKPQIGEDCPQDYLAGIGESFKDEQETVDFYHEIADKVSDPYLKSQFRRFAADEQNHAVWFSHFYFKNCCCPVGREGTEK